jgi:hypothetical protein
MRLARLGKIETIQALAFPVWVYLGKSRRQEKLKTVENVAKLRRFRKVGSQGDGFENRSERATYSLFR